MATRYYIELGPVVDVVEVAIEVEAPQVVVHSVLGETIHGGDGKRL